MSGVARMPQGAPTPSLTRWGASSDADLVYRTLATFGARPARLLALELGLSRHRVNQALSELHAYGAVEVPGGDRRAPMWTAQPPDQVVHRLRERRIRQAGEPHPARGRAVAGLLTERLSAIGVPAGPTLGGKVSEHVRYLPNRSLTGLRLAATLLGARHEHLVINNEETLNAELARAVPLGESFPQGVRHRVLGRPPLDGDAAVAPEEQLDIPEFRYRETLDTPVKLFVSDRRVAFLPAVADDVDRGYLEISHPGVVRQLIELFESRWSTAVDPRAGGVPKIILTARERDLIALLALGHTDLTASRELRISTRSVTNTLRALMDRVGVENRFQLGLTLGAMDAAAPPSLAEPPS